MKDYKIKLLLFLLAITLITLFSCCSWIYPLQPHDDANWFMAIGKSMLSGKLLYTEIHDQKGPLLFFLHEWAAAMSSKTFLGIYFLEVICCFGFLMLSYKTMRLFARHDISLISTCIVGVLTYTSDFMFYGDTVEELSLPILLYILYKTLLYAKSGVLPKDKESVFIGAGLAVVFWMKFTVLAMCVGAMIALLILAWRRRQMLLLLQCVTWVVAGIGGVTACVLLYFVAHGNEADLYHSYFYFNFFLYANRVASTPEAWWFVPLKWIGWGVLVSLVFTRHISRDVKIAATLCWGAELLTFVLFKVYLYYFLTVFVFAPLAAIYFVRGIRSRTIILTGATIITLFAVITNFNLMTLLSGNFPKAVLPLAEIVNADSDPNKQVLTIRSYDTGIYTLTDCLPPIKYFVTPNAYVEELVNEQTDYLQSCKAKYLIMKTEEPSYYGNFHPDLTHDYNLLCETNNIWRPEFLLHPMEFLWSLGYMRGLIEYIYTPERQSVAYRLYQRKHNVIPKCDSQAIIGEWKMIGENGYCYTLDFSKHRLVRCRKYINDEQKEDKTYSFTLKDNHLKLAYMFTGEEYKTAIIVEHTASKLVFHGWPRQGRCTFIKQ